MVAQGDEKLVGPGQDVALPMSEQWTGRPAARRQVVGDQRIQRVPVLPADGIELRARQPQCGCDHRVSLRQDRTAPIQTRRAADVLRESKHGAGQSHRRDSQLLRQPIGRTEERGQQMPDRAWILGRPTGRHHVIAAMEGDDRRRRIAVGNLPDRPHGIRDQRVELGWQRSKHADDPGARARR
jgi:hypothetical protein